MRRPTATRLPRLRCTLFPRLRCALLIAASFALQACVTTPTSTGGSQAEAVECLLLEPVVPECPAPEPKVVERVVKRTVVVERPREESILTVVGAVETVRVDPPGIQLDARIDTGATTSSIHADDKQEFERDGRRWVRFSLSEVTDENLRSIELPVERTVLIKRHNAESVRRYVVRMWVTLGDIREHIEVTLADREDFEYSLLIGRNFLTDTALVDVSRQYLVPTP